MVPVCLGVLRACDSLVLSRSGHGPASLSNPDRLALGSGLSLTKSVVEEGLTLVDAVGHGVLEVWVGVHSEPVASADECVVGAVHIRGPGVDVTNGDVCQSSASDSITDLLDVIDQSGRLSTRVATRGLKTSRRDTVQILAADGDTDGKRTHLGTELGDGVLQSGKLVVERILTGGGPETKQKGGLGVDGSWDGRDDGVGGASLDHGVEASTAEAGGADQALSSVELTGEGLEGLCGAIRVGGTIVETLSGGQRRGSARDEREERRRTHVWRT